MEGILIIVGIMSYLTVKVKDISRALIKRDYRLSDLVMNSEQHGILRVVNIWRSMEDKFLKIITENNNELCVTILN